MPRTPQKLAATPHPDSFIDLTASSPTASSPPPQAVIKQEPNDTMMVTGKGKGRRVDDIIDLTMDSDSE